MLLWVVCAVGAGAPACAKQEPVAVVDSDGDGTPDSADPEPNQNVRIELVESVPVETKGIDNEHIRNTREVWLEMIGGARRTLNIAQFYVNDTPGGSLEPVIQAVLDAAARGVQVRVMIEANMKDGSAVAVGKLQAAKNIQVAFYDISGLKEGGGIHHAKYFIVDGREAFVGSQNFDWKALTHIHELGLKINSDCVCRVLARVFEADWAWAHDGKKTWSTPIADADGDGVADAEDPNPKVSCWAPGSGKGIKYLEVFASPAGLNPPGIKWGGAGIIGLLDHAKESVSVQALSYSTEMNDGRKWFELDKAVRRALGRGIKVRMNLADWSKKAPRIDALKEIARAGAEVKFNTIPAYSGGWIDHTRVDHSKYMVVDGRIGWIGTSNWSGNYFVGTRNIEIIFEDDVVVPELKRIFERYWKSSYSDVLDPDKEYIPPKYE